MRRIVVTILLLLYTGLFAVGLPLNLHYCSGNFSGIILAVDENDCCGTDRTDNCCETKHAYLKAESNHANAPQVQTPAGQCLWLNTSFFISNTTVSSNNNLPVFTYRNESPPPLGAFILLCNLRL
jgi:hypothetical protein